MKLIEHWWKKWSVQLLAGCIAVAELAPYLPEVEAHLPADWYRFAFYAVLMARIVRQKNES
jgi:hypothetical protein